MPKLYALNQSALYKTRSKGRLAALLQIELVALKRLIQGSHFKVFPIRASVCEFTGAETSERWVQEPKGELRRVHDRLRYLLTSIVAPDYAHAAVKGRSYRSNAAAHKGADCVATFDISKFYPSTNEACVADFFYREMQCSADVAELLAAIICFRSMASHSGCLPTGSPVSPIMSIFANKALFDSLDRIACSSGLKFTCYVDDLTFSGPQFPPNLERRVKSILLSHGHRMHPGKTRFFPKGTEKHVTGVLLRGGALAVPHSRFAKARKVQESFRSATEPGERMRLLRKLAGMLGEASYLDPAYRSWADATYRELSGEAMRAVTTFEGEIFYSPAIGAVPQSR